MIVNIVLIKRNLTTPFQFPHSVSEVFSRLFVTESYPFYSLNSSRRRYTDTDRYLYGEWVD